MHTIGAQHTMFEITIDGQRASLADVLPGFGDSDRLAVVVRSALGGLGASALVLALVLDFYATHDDQIKTLEPGEILYPEHYVLHVGRARGDYAWLDFWPPDKEVVVDDSAETIVRSLLEHGITRVLIEDTPTAATAALADQLTQSFRDQIVTALAFSPTGRTVGADVSIASNATVEQWVGWTIDPERAANESDRPSAQSSDRLTRSSEVTDDERRVARQARTDIVDGSVPVETYRRLTTAQAIGLLSLR